MDDMGSTVDNTLSTSKGSAQFSGSDQVGTSHSTGDGLISHQPLAVGIGESTVASNIGRLPSDVPPSNGPNEKKDGDGQDEIMGDAGFGTKGGFTSTHGTDVQGVPYGVRDDDASEDTNCSESTNVPRRNLGFVQITSLMLNTTIGGGIFNTPGYVLALTRSKKIALILWAVGGVYSGLRMSIFLEYGTALPFNGGALIYLDEVFHWPRLMATVIFSCFWILLASTCTDAKTVALNILSLANPDIPPSDIADGQIRFTAVVVQTVVCLMLFFARRLCFVFNSTFALYKIILLLFIFIAGMVASRGPNSGFNDFNEEYPGYNGVDTLTAMIYIIFSYQGWENANYIAGEIRDCKRTLRWAGAAAILVTTALYMLATLAFYAVSDYATLTDDAGQDNSGLQFAQTIFGSSTGMVVAITLSVFSDQIFVTYATAKVKQAIAWQRIIPFYNFFGRQDPYFDSPGGALLLHWIFTVIPLLCFNTMSETRLFFSGIYSYGYQIMMVFLGIGLLRLKGRMRLLQSNWKPTYMKNNVVLIFVSFVFASINIVTLVMTALPEGQGSIPSFYWPITLGGVIGLGLIYWGILRILQVKGLEDRTLGSRIGLEVKVYEEGDENIPDEMKFFMHEAVGDGTRRRVQYKLKSSLDHWSNFTIPQMVFEFA